MNTKLPPLDEQMVSRFCEVLSAHKDVAMTVRSPDLSHEAMRQVLAGKLVHVMYRKGPLLLCTWVHKGWLSEVQWLMDCYGE